MVEVVVVSGSDDGMEAEEVLMKNSGGGGQSPEVVQWEKYLPKTALRVLLVEADDSTRQIIASLLRKCSYKVTAVPDGLMAWETLKGRPQTIDLILTELDLPSISGLALLTLAMEQETCKNIPVIMMSSQDSFSMVLKCMLRGAADYLIKPVRKNELRNLWQHVWRRQSSSAGHAHDSLPASQPKLEATAESSCSSRFKNMETKLTANDESVKELDECCDQIEGRKSCDATMDLIRTLDEQQPKNFYKDNCSSDHIGPELELSLERFCLRSSMEQDETERQKLYHSNTSAFSLYIEQIKKGNSDIRSATTSSNQDNIGSCISGQALQPVVFSINGSVPEGCHSTCTNSYDEGITGGGHSSSSEKPKGGAMELKQQQRSSQREAALTKFRMKRKDRCFEKKVQYQSRKKLAEQRPRVRGQFVRAPKSEIAASDVFNGA